MKFAQYLKKIPFFPRARNLTMSVDTYQSIIRIFLVGMGGCGTWGGGGKMS